MQPSPIRDLTVGLFVLAGLTAIAYLSVQVGGLQGERGFHLYATFDQIGGLRPRAPVVVSGVQVGQVSSIELDENLRARVNMDVDPSLELPGQVVDWLSCQLRHEHQFVTQTACRDIWPPICV